jgi:hypothetical protein
MRPRMSKHIANYRITASNRAAVRRPASPAPTVDASRNGR